jgi:hypothetical protein
MVAHSSRTLTHKGQGQGQVRRKSPAPNHLRTALLNCQEPWFQLVSGMVALLATVVGLASRAHAPSRSPYVCVCVCVCLCTVSYLSPCVPSSGVGSKNSCCCQHVNIHVRRVNTFSNLITSYRAPSCPCALLPSPLAHASTMVVGAATAAPAVRGVLLRWVAVRMIEGERKARFECGWSCCLGNWRWAASRACIGVLGRAAHAHAYVSRCPCVTHTHTHTIYLSLPIRVVGSMLVLRGEVHRPTDLGLTSTPTSSSSSSSSWQVLLLGDSMLPTFIWRVPLPPHSMLVLHGYVLHPPLLQFVLLRVGVKEPNHLCANYDRVTDPLFLALQSRVSVLTFADTHHGSRYRCSRTWSAVSHL